jgi:hypothetical protein
MKLWSDFFENVIPFVPGCPAITAEVAIKNAVIDFCEKSLILQRDHDPVSVVANQADYDLEPPRGYLVVKIMQAWFENNPLATTMHDYVNDPTHINAGFPDAKLLVGRPTHILQKDERTFTLLAVPEKSIANAVTLRVALKPSRASTGVDDVVWEDYAEVIANGAKARLMMTAGVPYTNPQSAGASALLYQQGLNLARSRAAGGYGRGNLQVKMRRI